jgi:hypothetical protein
LPRTLQSETIGREMAHKFDPQQKIDAQGHLAKATGEVEVDQEMFWIAAFVFQNAPGHYAAAWGDTGWGGGKAKQWVCDTTMAPGSQPFQKGKARAWALARVSDEGGKFFGWGHEVDLV